MKYLASIFILVLALCSCSDAPDKDCLETTTLEVQQIILPDSTRLSEPMNVEVEVVRPNVRYKYTGPIISSTDTGCTITISGEIDWCELGIPTVTYERHTFDIRPEQSGEYTVEVNNNRSENLSDTIIVF